MTITKSQKELIKRQIRANLSKEREIQKIVIFGSFVHSDNPNDIDVAVFQNSNEKYLPLALKYRKLVRDVSIIIPIDIFPLKANAKGAFLSEVETGETIYER